NLTEKAEWSFAPWSLPSEKSFRHAPSTSANQPAWFRCRFNISHTAAPLWLEPVGMSKGQFYLNGHNLGRYFVATASGKTVPPQHRYYLPEAWLKVGELNELMLFDEHGKAPSKCRLAYDAMGPYGE